MTARDVELMNALNQSTSIYFNYTGNYPCTNLVTRRVLVISMALAGTSWPATSWRCLSDTEPTLCSFPRLLTTTRTLRCARRPTV